MSTWTSDAARLRLPCLALAGVLALGGCVAPGGGALGFGAGQPSETRAPVRRVAFYDGKVVIEGPPGYCIDTDSVRRNGGGRFVLLARCASLGADTGEDADPGVITVSVLPFDADVEPPRAAQIAAAQRPAGVLAEIDGEDVALVHLAQGGDAVVPGGDPRHWRAGMVVNGHLVGIAAYAEAGGVLAGNAGRAVLSDMAARLRALSPTMRRVPAPDTAADPARKPSTPARTALGRLFRKST